MKKMNLTIPKPCHESWDEMTPAEQGRFCGACQKTVIDFSNMSDRELAAFFKKPAGPVCGRFQQDQLNREITIPKKRIPWLRYFFHIAWPAFILMLKSCGPKDRVMGKPATTLTATNAGAAATQYNDILVGTVAIPLMEEELLEPIAVKGEVAPEVIVDTAMSIMGDIVVEIIESSPIMDSVVKSEGIGVPDSTFVTMDTVTVTASGSQSCSRITGMVSQVTVDYVQEDPAPFVKPAFPGTTLLAYPNPVRAGGLLNLKWATGDVAPVSIRVLTASGQRIIHKQVNGTTQVTTPVQMPTNLTPGIYFVQLLFPDGKMDEVTVMVNR